MNQKQQLHPQAVLLPGAVLDGEVVLERGVSVWYYAVLRGDLAPVIVGEDSNIQEQAVLHVDTGRPVVIGRGVTVGHAAILHGCEIGDNTVIGMGAIVLNGAKIGKNCIIGAGSLVTQGQVIPDGCVAFGNPARVRRPLREEEIEENRENARVYLRLGKEAAGRGMG